jgi:predicted acylesterase/phospholipase RssA
LAFQGGGAKGIAYIGAYKFIKEKFPTTKIRSIIGSSAGGMLALAMTTGASI